MDIVMLPGKPYSIVCYASVQEAMAAHDRLQGWQLRPPSGPSAAVILYLSFINEVPRPKMSRSHPSLPPGLILLEDFISAETEAALTGDKLWEEGDQSEEAVRMTLKHRKVRHFGYEFNYATNNVDKDSPLPDPIPPLYTDIIDRIMATGLVENKPDQITINEYQPGQGIPPHVDTHSAFQEAIISLSLGSQVLMEFSNPVAGRHVPVFLPRRSLLIMTGEARYLWSHGITPRKSDVIPAHMDGTKSGTTSDEVTENDQGLTLMQRGVRRSLTFRAVRGAPCHCAYPSRCDTQLAAATSHPQPTAPTAPSLPTSALQAIHLEATHVHQVYDSIAGHFSQTRHKPWPHVLGFLQSLPMGSILLDVGCGNGKYLDGNPSIFSFGCDRSVKLVEICKERRFQAFSCDGLNLPVRSASIDACICIAVIHHFSTQNRRLTAVKEIARVLRPDGLGLIYVWAKEQEKDRMKSYYISSAARKKKKNAHPKEDDVQSEDVASNEDCMENSLHTEDVTSDGDGTSKDIHLDSNRYAPTKNNIGHSEDSKSEDSNLESKDVQRTDRASGGDKALQCSSEESGCLSEDITSSVNRTRAEISATAKANQNLCETDSARGANGSLLKIQDTDGNYQNRESICDKSYIQPESASVVLSIHKNRTEFESQDMLVPWHLKKQTGEKDGTPTPKNGTGCEEEIPVYHRFYHVFQEGELEALCRMVDGLEIKSSHYDQGNWGIVIRKL
ncbi:alkylated DNA repair protein alkB homolog 8-like isoform X2 [Acanthaster planci]|nr:alkylated DNA repair protein alkB homolog 8-like isoform X2 [Acanthaster planci]XP_022086772.1 alkylated DNA repair protein alkB homolog 8-like isoform X2 [Acanthaster planci]